MKLPPLASDLNEFVNVTGLLDAENLMRLFPKFIRSIDVEEDGAFEAHGSNLTKLLKLVSDNPTYHIISEVEDDDGTGVVYSNEIRYVNRLKYYIGKGSKKELDYCETIYDDREED